MRVTEALVLAPLRLLDQPPVRLLSPPPKQPGPCIPAKTWPKLIVLAFPGPDAEDTSTSVPKEAIHLAACIWAAAVPIPIVMRYEPTAVATTSSVQLSYSLLYIHCNNYRRKEQDKATDWISEKEQKAYHTPPRRSSTFLQLPRCGAVTRFHPSFHRCWLSPIFESSRCGSRHPSPANCILCEREQIKSSTFSGGYPSP